MTDTRNNTAEKKMTSTPPREDIYSSTRVLRLYPTTTNYVLVLQHKPKI